MERKTGAMIHIGPDVMEHKTVYTGMTVHIGPDGIIKAEGPKTSETIKHKDGTKTTKKEQLPVDQEKLQLLINALSGACKKSDANSIPPANPPAETIIVEPGAHFSSTTSYSDFTIEIHNDE
jgi:hypothetical protein